MGSLQNEIDAISQASLPVSRFEISTEASTLAFSISLNTQDDVKIVCSFEGLANWPEAPLLSVRSSHANELINDSLMDLTERLTQPYILQSLVTAVSTRVTVMLSNLIPGSKPNPNVDDQHDQVMKACELRPDAEDGSRHRRALSFGAAMDVGSDSEGNNAYDEEMADYHANDDDDQEEDNDDDDEVDEDDRELMVDMGRRQGRWDKHEELHAEKTLMTGLSPLEALAKKQQIFEPKESFLMLSKDILSIIRQQRFDLFVDSIGDDVYAWSVEMCQFDPASPLAKDMVEIQKRYSYSSISIIIRFKRGLHPFYPPAVEIVRPHLKGCLSAALASHPMLKLGSWDPTMSVDLMLNHIKTFLENNGRVDLDHPMNQISRFPDSAYEPVEILLARLNALSGLPLPSKPLSALMAASGRTDPLSLYSCYQKEAERMETMAAAESGKKRKKEQEEKEAKQGRTAVWAKGTGYGYGEGRTQEVWDVKASEVTQAARDEELRILIELIALEVNRDSDRLKGGEDGMQVDTPLLSTSMDMFTKLNDSCIVQFLLAEVHPRLAFSEMCSRAPLYLACTDLILAIASHRSSLLVSSSSAASSFGTACINLLSQGDGGDCSSSPDQPSTSSASESRGSSLASILTFLLPSACQFAKITRSVFEEDKEQQKQQDAASVASSSSTTPAKTALAQKEVETRQEMADGMTLANRIDLIVALLPKAKEAGSSHGPSSSSRADDSYQAALRPLQVDYTPSLITRNHCYQAAATAECVKPRPRVTRLAREMSGLNQMLPLDAGSSIFVRVDESQCIIWRCLITGPEDTPYSGGCFVFDFYFPSSYPGVPPQVTLKTTGGGRVRFNPNLYNNGKVCLSLLGTWEGGKGEGWNHLVSTAIQVLLSIQSLILVPQPFYNEPGHERQGSEAASREYNRVIEAATIKWAMIDLLQHPPPELKEVIEMHFKLRKQFILDQTEKWIEKAESPTHATELRGLLDQLQPLLEKL